MATKGQPEKTARSTSEQVQGILSTSRDAEFLQSFLRVDLGPEEETPPPRRRTESPQQQEGKAGPPRPSPPPSSPGGERQRGTKTTTFSQLTRGLDLHRKAARGSPGRRKAGRSGRGERARLQEEVYTDKDRAAAVVMGSRDIKQSLRLKRKQDRSRALQIPEEAEPGTLLALGSRQMRGGDVRIAINFVHKALELNPNDKNALVARSKCYLLLGEPQMALQDAETALQGDKNFIRGLFQKAESLYHLGDFEHSLMYYHRGLRLRPELEGFRLGVQKAQEAIENTIGSQSKSVAKVRPPQPCPSVLSGSSSERERKSGVDRKRDGSSTSRSRPASSSSGQRQSRHLLGELSLDKEYLEQLLRHPDIKCCSNQRKNNNIATFAEEGIAFLKNRQEFWRQQRPTTSSKKAKEHQQAVESTTRLVH